MNKTKKINGLIDVMALLLNTIPSNEPKFDQVKDAFISLFPPKKNKGTPPPMATPPPEQEPRITHRQTTAMIDKPLPIAAQAPKFSAKAFLNKDEFHQDASIMTVATKDCMTIFIRDCKSKIALTEDWEFSKDAAKRHENALFKIDTLIENLQQLRAFVLANAPKPKGGNDGNE